MKNKFYFYIVLFLLICLLPSAGLCLTGVTESSENREPAPAPELFAEHSLNPSFFHDAGTWFEDHFAFRPEAVTGYALLLGKGFGVSAQEGVITGKDGWLFYKDSLADFQGTEPMTERQLFTVAHTLAMVQAYARKNGAAFAFAAAPNKNSLYGEYMPYYYQPQHTNKSNLERLTNYLNDEAVTYIDLYQSLQNDGRVLYHKRDSHWNNAGAALAADLILSSIGKEHSSYADRTFTVRKDFQGDLDRMLYPAAVKPEEEIYYDPAPQFDYCEDVDNHFAPKISTRAAGSGSLVMYRDSFGNALLPFLAEAFESAWFSRALPYQLSDLSDHAADTLIIERAERFLPDMAKQAPVMEAPAVVWDDDIMERAVQIEDLEETVQGTYTQITGKLPADMIKERSRIYIRVNADKCYEAFPVSMTDGQEGFSILLRTNDLQASDLNLQASDLKPQASDPILEAYLSEQDAAPAVETQAEDADESENGERTVIRREDYPDCDGSGHGYAEIYYSDGSVEIEEY